MKKRDQRPSQTILHEEDRPPQHAVSPESDETYEFTCLAWPPGRLVVRVTHRGGETILLARETPRLLDEERVWTKSLSAGEWEALQQALCDADFWHLPEDHPQMGLDGESWTLAGRRGERFHSSSWWSPGQGPFFELGRLFAKLAGTTLPRSAS